MDRESNMFGLGPKELTGALDLIDHFKLVRHHEFFCKKLIPGPVSKARYLNDVVGATEIISKGDGIQLGQLVQKEPCSATKKRELIQVFDLVDLSEAFKFRGTVVLPRGYQSCLSKVESKDNKQQEGKIKEPDGGSKKPRNIHKQLNKHTGGDKKAKISCQDTTSEAGLLDKKRNHGGDDNHNVFPRQKRK